MKKIKVVIITILFLSLVVFNKKVKAQYGQYGPPTPSYSIVVDKMVGKPYQTKGGITNLEYVDNLTPSDPRFAPNQEIYFKIKVKNTSTSDITNVTVKDYVPLYLTPIEGPGTWDQNTRIISWNAGDFQVDEEKVYYIKMKINPQNQLPADKGLFCLVNKVEALSDEAVDDDNAQFCIEKQVTGVKKVPSAGPEMGILLLSTQFALLGTGIILKKKI